MEHGLGGSDGSDGSEGRLDRSYFPGLLDESGER